MPKRSSTLAALAVAAAACGSTSATTPAPPAPSPSHARDVYREIDGAKADCMKEKGFKYVAWTPPEPPMTEEDKMRASTDYAVMKAYRAEHGFGIVSVLVHPRDGAQGDQPRNPNYKIVKDLSPAQRKAYAIQGEKCHVQAIKQITGEDVRSPEEWSRRHDKDLETRKKRALDGDPELVEQAAAMAGCMTTKGYRIGATTPTAMRDWGFLLFSKELHELARKEDKTIPAFDPETGTGNFPTGLTEGEKQAILKREIKTALDDLECGKDFHPAMAAMSTRLDNELGE